MENTRDLSQFGNRELRMAAELLNALINNDLNKTERLGSGVALEFNPNSAHVFLVDEDFNTAMMNGKYLEDFFSCPECGCEGFREDLASAGSDCCRDFLGDEVAS